MNKQPINPVTFDGSKTRLSEQKVKLTILRIGLGHTSDTEYKLKPGQQRIKKGEEEFDTFITVMLWIEGPPGEPPNVLGTMSMDHDHFVKGLGHLFPNGELEKVHLEKP